MDSIKETTGAILDFPPKFRNLSEMAAIDASRLTENEAREILERIRWPKSPVCPHCGGKNVTRLADSEKYRDGLIQCNNMDCRKQFTVMIKTVMQDSQETYLFFVLYRTVRHVVSLQEAVYSVAVPVTEKT